VLASTASASTAKFGALSYRPTELSMLSGDTSRAEQILGWRARISLDEGLDRTIAWFRDVGAGLPEYQLADGASTR
jgi:nucleoside-diphosphate-sugar epimerase